MRLGIIILLICYLLLFLAVSIGKTHQLQAELQAKPAVIIRYDTITVLTPAPSDVYTLARLIESERTRSRADSVSGAIAIGDVAVNRLERALRKGKIATIDSIIRRPGQFDGIHSQRFNQTPKPLAFMAALTTLMGFEMLPDEALYFHNPVTSTDSKWINYIGKYKIAHYGGHDICIAP